MSQRPYFLLADHGTFEEALMMLLTMLIYSFLLLMPTLGGYAFYLSFGPSCTFTLLSSGTAGKLVTAFLPLDAASM
jgi:hypothetical protein